MKKFNIGLDFGTYQTKVCVYDLENDVHEFFTFPSNNSFFLPSRVGLKSDGRFEYGDIHNGSLVKEYYYFKMAAAEDKEFRIETSTESNILEETMYEASEYAPFTPEFLVTIYVTYVILIVKEEYSKRRFLKKEQGSFLSRLFNVNEKSSEEIGFTVNMGIPTEWSQVKKLRRKRKFENILLAANFLQEKYINSDSFIIQKSENLVQDLRGFLVKHEFPSKELFYENLNSAGLKVTPETEAGLTFIMSTGQLGNGYYAIMDIGGGTTDISFFQITEGVLKYLASESYMMAANNVYKRLLGDNDSIFDMHQIEKEIKKAIADGSLDELEAVKLAIKIVRRELELLIQKLFMKRVYSHDKGRMLNKFKDQPIIVYGGGLGLNGIVISPTAIYNFGLKIYTPGTRPIEMRVVPVDNYSNKVNILPEASKWANDFYLLVVALGLSFILSDKNSEWIDSSEYTPTDGDSLDGGNKTGPGNMEAHPFNEDCYIYNILMSKWE